MRNLDRRSLLKSLLYTSANAYGLTQVSIPAVAKEGRALSHRISLDGAVVEVDKQENSFVQYGAKDLAAYLTAISDQHVNVNMSPDVSRKAKATIGVGEIMMGRMGVGRGLTNELGDEGFVIRSFDKAGTKVVIVAGRHPKGTNAGIAALMQMIRFEGEIPYIEGPLDLRTKPRFAVRGIHLNGWPLSYPWGYRAWKEEDWNRFADIAWVQRANLIMIWPMIDILPVPLSAEDEAYLQSVRRVVDYAQKQRGLEVWIMHSANRIGISDCGSRDPRFRLYWIKGCQKDMNPAVPQQFENIMKSFEVLYRIVDNADAVCMIDSDPGGWPHSPLSEQVKIFKGARKLLDRYSVHKRQAKLIDWMWTGWGRHESDVAFMAETISKFKKNLPEPWGLIAGMAPYLRLCQDESVLSKTVYLPYGAIEHEPSFPATNLGLDPICHALDQAAQYPGLRGVMGNNEIMLLQFPRTYNFLASAWDYDYRTRTQGEELQELCRNLYPDHKDLIADSFLALRETDPLRIGTTLNRLKELIKEGNAGRPGAIGRYLFPDQLVVARSLVFQLCIRLTRQSLLKGLRGKPDVSECATLVEDYFDKLLTWNKQTGWERMIDVGIWTAPIYEQGKDFKEAMVHLKQVLGQGAPYTSYAQIEAFFDGIRKDLLQKYGQNSVMVGCVEPLKLAVLQAPRSLFQE